MHAMAVLVIPERLQRSRPINQRGPEANTVQVLAPDRADQTLNERMRNRCVGDVEPGTGRDPDPSDMPGITRR